MAKSPRDKEISTIKHDRASRLNNPTAELADVFEQSQELLGEKPATLRLGRSRPLAPGEERPRDADHDPQLVWRGKDQQDWSDLVVNAPPLFIQEKIKPQVIIEDLKRQSKKARDAQAAEPDLFADFNGIHDPAAETEFYQHSKHWQNRFILGDSLQVMASLAEREAMRGKVQCIYFDPPYGIKFNSNWQVSTMSRDVKDGKKEDVSREPEQVKAFRDTWKDGIHSYLTYLRDRLMVARELLTESGSIFVQIGDENVHRVRAVMDEVFGEENFVSIIAVRKTTSEGSTLIGSTADFLVWYGRFYKNIKYRSLLQNRSDNAESRYSQTDVSEKQFRTDNITSSRAAGDGDVKSFEWFGRTFLPGNGTFKTTKNGLIRLGKADRLESSRHGKLNYKRFQDDYGFSPIANLWTDISGAVQSRSDPKVYVVQTGAAVIERCILMTTDPGDLVLDPTCGSGTTAYVAEQWGRRWITIDTSRVALALARTRLMSARYPFYLLADSREGRAKEQELTGTVPPDAPVLGDITQGFVYERVPHITLKSIANNAEIDVIWEKWQAVLEPLRLKLNERRKTQWEEWEIPRKASTAWPKAAAYALKTARDTSLSASRRELALDGIRLSLGRLFTLDDLPEEAEDPWDDAEAVHLHAQWWEARIARQKEIDESIARAADIELLYDRPYEDKSKVRVAGPFTVESLSPHRIITAREDMLGAELAAAGAIASRASTPHNVPEADLGAMVLAHLRTAGVHQHRKSDTIRFSSIEPWPGRHVSAEARFSDGGQVEKRAAILIGPEYGTLTRVQIAAAAREASEARFDLLIACAFNFDAQASDYNSMGALPILKARMNPDLHMAEDLKNTGKGNLFVVFGEPDVSLIHTPEGELQVKVHGIDVFDPSTGEIRSDDAAGIAAWFIDTNYNEESFFVRHAYFLGANQPYNALKSALKAEIDPDAWESLYSDTSRPFPRPDTGRIAIKVINHFGDEVLKVCEGL